MTTNSEHIHNEARHDYDLSELEEIKTAIDNAISECQQFVEEKPFSIMNEDDFKWRLANLIDIEIGNSQNLGEKYSVHTEVSYKIEENQTNFHYITEKKGERVDILIYDITCFDKDENNKLRYNGLSFALELKHIRLGQSADVVYKDIEKRGVLEMKSWLYIVDLVDEGKRGKTYSKKEREIKEKVEEYGNEYENAKIYCCVLKRNIFAEESKEPQIHNRTATFV